MFSVIKASGLAVFLSLMFAACGGLDVPAVPGNFRMAGNQSDLIILSWEAPTSGSAATAYEVSRDGNVIASAVTDTSVVDRGLTASTAYSYTLRARDAAGNWSVQSPALVVSTLPGNVITPPDSANVPAGYHRVWSEEFDYTGLPDSTKWGFDSWGNEIGWGNGELQFYTQNDPDNAWVSGGKLRITALKETTSAEGYYGPYTRDYTSARLVTMVDVDHIKASWTYGYFEIRAKMPCGAGTWPAIWMVGVGSRWPIDGEIDILEHFYNGWPTFASANVHFGTYANHQAGRGDTGLKFRDVPDICSAFHNYWLLWTEDKLEIGVDGNAPHLTYPRVANATYEQWPFSEPQAMLLNLAIDKGPVDQNMFPRTMEVDYVRVYQKP